MTVDQALIGEWEHGPSRVRIDADGWFWSLGASQPFTISPDGHTLDFPNTTKPWTFTRLMGAGQSLIGVWTRTELDGSDTWEEEWLFRASGTTTSQWRMNGAFDSEYQGIWVQTGGTVVLSERRALIVTATAGQIEFEIPFGANFAGTYSVSPDGAQWTLDLAGNQTIYTKV